MTRRRLLTLAMLFTIALLIFTVLAAPGMARELLGCDGVIQWPCPGPKP